MIVARLSAEPLNVRALVESIRRDDCGGLVVFEGTTRSPSDGKVVERLEYEAYESRATAQLDALARTALDRFDVKGVVAVHRTGVVPVGEPSVVVACAAEHRGDAFDAARWLIDAIKAEVAIWKKELFAGGDSAWVGVDRPT